MTTYARINSRHEIVELYDFTTVEQATEHYRTHARQVGDSQVVLDLAEGQTPRIGDTVTPDDEGVATID